MRSSGALDSGSSGPGSSPGRVHCGFPGQDARLSQGPFPLRCINELLRRKSELLRLSDKVQLGLGEGVSYGGLAFRLREE